MHIAVLTFTNDEASMNIRERMLEKKKEALPGSFKGYPIFDFSTDLHTVRMYTLDKECVHVEHIDSELPEKADAIIFATKHASKSGVHSLSVHAPGNWGDNQLGGKERFLCRAMPAFMREGFFRLREVAQKYESMIGGIHYEVIYEATHHGPEIETPCMFIEIGSDESSWVNIEAGRVIADTILHLLSHSIEERPPFLGIGGLHHCPSFVKVVNAGMDLGHICAKYALESLDEEMIQQGIEKCRAKEIILDWKGLGKEKDRIVGLLERMGIAFKRTKEF